jgi:hypothetical protein
MCRPDASRLRAAALLALLSSLLISGCQRSLFETAPAEALTCDAALVGHWLSQDEGEGEEGEMQAFIDDGCRLHTVERRNEGQRTSAPVQIGTFRLGRHAVLAVDAEWANRSFEINASSLDQPGDVYLYAYQLRGRDGLQLLPVRHKALAQRALDGDIEADALLLDGSLTVRVRGNAQAQREQLRGRWLFDTRDPLLFRRAAVDSSP